MALSLTKNALVEIVDHHQLLSSRMRLW